MDKILSTRLDEGTYQLLSSLAKQLKLSKKALLGEALQHYAQLKIGSPNSQLLQETSGVWKRQGTPQKTTQEIREKFNRAMRRHQ